MSWSIQVDTPKALKIVKFQDMGIHLVTQKSLKTLKFRGGGIHRNINFNVLMDTSASKLEDVERFSENKMDISVDIYTTTFEDFSDLIA